MAKKRLNAAEVLTLLDSDEECDVSDEVMAEGSDEEFFQFEELENLHNENVLDDGKHNIFILFRFICILYMHRCRNY